MASTPMSRIKEFKRKRSSHQFAFVLLSQFGLIALYPMIGWEEGPRPGPFGLLAIAVFLAGLYQVAEERRIRTLGVVLCILGASANVLAIFAYHGPWIIPAELCGIIYMAFVASVILWKVLSAAKVTVETLYGAVCAYLFIAIVWGMAYLLVDQISPGSFRYTYDASKRLAWPDYSFFSIVTVTTIGAGFGTPTNCASAGDVISAIAKEISPRIFAPQAD